MAQHLKAVEAAAEVGKATVEGARLGSGQLLFEPRDLCSGDFRFDIGTAGSTSLVLQTILPALSLASTNSTLRLIGGTHVPWSPCFHFLEMHWLRYMREIGFDIDLQLDRAGFYPQGGGNVLATVRPASHLRPLHLTERGALKRIRGMSAVANLSESIAERQRSQALKRLSHMSKQIEIGTLHIASPSRGSFLLLLAEFEKSQCCFCGLGALRKPAETVADETVNEFLAFLATDGSIDPYLSDQLVLPLALAEGSSEIRTSKITQHLTTNIEIVKLFLPVSIEIEGAIDQPRWIRIRSTESAIRKRSP
jgi:RNA 3'-terminal phosphate cyclase (ATP)